MESHEIERIIRKYDLIRNGDKIGTYKRSVNATEFRKEVGPHKEEILAYMKAKEAEKVERYVRRRETFESIPGVKELRAAREDNAKWRAEFNRMMDTGSSVMLPGYIHHSDEEMDELEARYPLAVIALEIQNRATNTSNMDLSEIYGKAYEDICDGADILETKETMDAELKENAERHMWD